MNNTFNLKMDRGVFDEYRMFQSLKSICEYIKHRNKAQEVHHYR